MATNVDAKLLKQTKFPPEFNQKVDMKKVNVEVMKKWIAGKISEILGSEDDVVIELCFNLLEGSRFPDIKVLQIQLTGFLDKDTPKFCKELWSLCLSAQSNQQGVPKELLEAKKLELIQEKIDAEKAAEEAQRRKEQEKTREKNIDNLRQRERAERGRGRGRGDRSYHEYDRRPRQGSRSPPPRRRQSPYRDDFRGPPRRDFIDTYVPGDRERRRYNGRYRSPSPSRPSRRSVSRSMTPTRRHQEDGVRPKRRHYSTSRSPAPAYRGGGKDRERRHLDRRGGRARSYSFSDTSRSPSPRRPRRRRSPSSLSHSPTPPSRSRHRKHRRDALSSPSMSRSRSRSLRRDPRVTGRSRRSPSHTSDELDDARADARKGRRHHENRRRSRSRSRSRSRHSNVKPARKAPSKSPTPPRQRERKRHRSIERYAPAARRRRNTSSVSSPVGKRHRKADSSAEEANRQPPGNVSKSPENASSFIKRTEETQPRSPTQTANELREKLLREKVLALRKASTNPKDQSTNTIH